MIGDKTFSARLAGSSEIFQHFEVHIIFLTIDNWYSQLIIEEPVIKSQSNNDNTFQIFEYHIEKTPHQPTY